MIGGQLLDFEYIAVQIEAFQVVLIFHTICITIDGVTTTTGKQVLNVIESGPTAIFIEHFLMDLASESAEDIHLNLISIK